MRVSVYPAVLGEKVVVRFFHGCGPDGSGGRSSVPSAIEELKLENLGFVPSDSTRLAGYLRRPQGMVLLTGPANSGKTTTLYVALREILEQSAGQRQIVTIEDPVERIVPGVTQTELKPAAKLNCSAALRALLRQDPEVIMIGEIRDSETAQLAVQAALTGHLILSTLHAPSGPEVLLRLLHLGVDLYLTASVVSAVVEQRLVRRLCACKEPATGEDREIEPFRPAGCEECAHTGYKGRVLVAQLLPVEGPVREAVLARKDSVELMSAAARVGWRGLWARGAELVAEGVTTYAELRRILVEE